MLILVGKKYRSRLKLIKKEEQSLIFSQNREVFSHSRCLDNAFVIANVQTLIMEFYLDPPQSQSSLVGVLLTRKYHSLAMSYRPTPNTTRTKLVRCQANS